ncbi:MAG: KAP family NTPase [Muribaculaceae bacterium]|nr:KAP family NTPase [Muribaculaceae bacterium]
MDKVTQAVLQYLNNHQTLGALQIDGPWGCGKTHFVKNFLLDAIEQNEKDRVKDASSRDFEIGERVPLMISLFGIKSIEEISRQLLFASTKSRYGFSEKRIDKIKEGLTTIAKFIPYVKDVDWEKAFKISPETCLRMLNEDSIVILDDLERLSTNIDIEDVLGFVNDLVENYNFKVILISNQDKFNESSIKFKEKVIEKTIPFRIDAFSIVKEMAREYHSLLPDFLSLEYVKRFLMSEKDNYEQAKILSNLRTIRFAISQFAPIFNYYTEKKESVDSLDSVTLSKLYTLWRFTLAIAIEYRLGHISSDKKNNLENAGMSFMFNNILFEDKETTDQEKEESYEDKFFKNYYESFDMAYHHITEVYEFIVEGQPLNFEKVDESVSKSLGIWKEKMDDELSFTSSFFERISSFSDAEAQAEFIKFKDLISKGKVSNLFEILNAGNILFKFKDLLDSDEKDIENCLIMGVDYFTSSITDEQLSSCIHHLEIYVDNIRPEVKSCYDYIKTKIISSIRNREDEYIHLLSRLFVENIEKFTDEFIPKPVSPNVMSISSPILHKMDMELVTKRVKEMNTAKEVETLSKMVYFRFGDNPQGHWEEEICFLEAIQEGLKYLSDEDKTLSAIYKRQVLRPRIEKLIIKK